MFKTLAAALIGSCSVALETTKIDMSMYGQPMMFAQTASKTETGATAQVCNMQVHSVKPDLNIGKIPAADYRYEELPSFLKRRIARRAEETG